MTSPKRVRVLGHTLRVEFTPQVDEDDSAGSIDYDIGVIKIRNGLPIDEQKSTLVHELLHGVSDGMGLEWKEARVQETERVVFALLRDNPTAVRWIISRGEK